MKVFYDNDPDGCCGAYLLYKAHENKTLEQEPLQLFTKGPKTKINVRKIYPDESVYIVDTSISPENMEDLLEKTSNVFWIDHHITSMKTYRDYGINPGGLRDLSYSSCENVFRFLFGDYVTPPKMVSLVGSYDIWRKGFREEALPFVYGVQTESIHPIKGCWSKADQNPQEYIDRGKFIYSYQKQVHKEQVKKSHEIKLEGLKGLAINTINRGSLIFDEHPQKDDYDFLLVYTYDGNEYSCSIYSKMYDVSKIALKYGGGGHKAAAGFRCKSLPFQYI